MKLTNKVAIVTGSATGIGQAIAVRLAAEGTAVVVNYRKTPPDETMRLINAIDGKAFPIQANVSDASEVRMLVEQTVERFGTLDIVINNAGIESKKVFIDFSPEEIQKIISVNLVGPMLVIQASARQMIEQKSGGRIINISSVHEDLPMPTNAPYCATKGALRMLTRTLSVELAPYSITVNNIGPGAIYTPIDKEIQKDPEMEKALLAEIPLGRWGKPEEVASLAAFLASDEAAYITGSTYFIDGGMLRQAGSL